MDHAAVSVDGASLDDGGVHPTLLDDGPAAAAADDDDDRRPLRGGRVRPGPGHHWLGVCGGSHFDGFGVVDGLLQVSVKICFIKFVFFSFMCFSEHINIMSLLLLLSFSYII